MVKIVYSWLLTVEIKLLFFNKFEFLETIILFFIFVIEIYHEYYQHNQAITCPENYRRIGGGILPIINLNNANNDRSG